MASPNLLYFHCHDLGRHLPVYQTPVEAPNLERFATESVVFDQAFTSSPACTPSRGCALSGRYAHTTGCIGLAHMGWPLDLSQQTIVDDLNEAGYETILSGVNHERHPNSDRYARDLTRTWEDWSTGKAVDNALSYLESRDTDQPFFLNVGSQQPHAGTWHQFEKKAVDPENVWMPIWMEDRPEWRHELGKFEAAIQYMDHHFGRLMEGLASLNLEKETIVVFTTDHGISGPRTKSTLYERGLEIALMIRLPDGEGAGTRRNQLIGNVDFRPTWLDLLSLPVPEEIEGTSFLPLVQNPDIGGQRMIFAERNFHGEKIPEDAAGHTDFFDPLRSVRTSDFHYIRNFEPAARQAHPLPFPEIGRPDRPEEELYDLRHDPQEFVNVAGRPEYRMIQAELQTRLDEWMQATGDFLPDGPPPKRPMEPGWGPWA